MARYRIGRMLAAVAAIVCLFASAARAEFFEEKTKHYSVQTDVSKEFTKLVSQHMEAIYKEYARRLESFGDVNGRFNVVVFNRREDYIRRVPDAGPASGGAFVSHLKLLATFLEGHTHEDVFRTLYHEGLHQFVFSVVSPTCPIWLNEGLAEYFSYASWNNKRFVVGQTPTRNLRVLQAAIRAGNVIPFERMLGMTPQQWVLNMNNAAGLATIQYSQAWGMVHFLVHANGGRYSKLLQRYIRKVADGKNSAEAFVDVFGNDTEAFQTAWREYILKLEPDPKFVCRDNMAAILWLALSRYTDQTGTDPSRFKDLDSLRKDVLGGRVSWQIQLPAAGLISSKDPEKAASLFRCPHDPDKKSECSYLLAHPNDSKTPVLVCTHHPGILIKAYYVQASNGRWGVQVEEVVRGTVAQPLREAVIRASKAK